MARDAVKISYDREADLLEVLFSAEPGTFEETANDRVMVRLSKKNEVIGFSILGLSTITKESLDLLLQPVTFTG